MEIETEHRSRPRLSRLSSRVAVSAGTAVGHTSAASASNGTTGSIEHRRSHSGDTDRLYARSISTLRFAQEDEEKYEDEDVVTNTYL